MSTESVVQMQRKMRELQEELSATKGEVDSLESVCMKLEFALERLVDCCNNCGYYFGELVSAEALLETIYKQRQAESQS